MSDPSPSPFSVDLKASPESIERALEAFSLRVELQTCEVVERFRGILNKLPLTAAFLKSDQWRAIVGDALLSENRTRTNDIKARLAELDAD